MNDFKLDDTEKQNIEDELVSVGDNRKLYELDAIEVLKRDSSRLYSKDELVHSSCRVSAEILDDVSDIRRTTGLSETKIYRAINIHGSSLIHNKYDDKSRKFDELAGKMCRMKNVPYVRMVASQVSESPLFHSMDYCIKKNMRFVEWASSYIGGFGEKMFIVRADMMRAAFCFSLGTFENAINRDIYEKEVSSFGDYVNGKLFVFESICEKYDEIYM